MTTIRQRKEKGIEVYFEKENIWTFDGKGELLLTIMSSLAQEESRSISEYCTWGQRKRFADGKVTVTLANAPTTGYLVQCKVYEKSSLTAEWSSTPVATYADGNEQAFTPGSATAGFYKVAVVITNSLQQQASERSQVNKARGRNAAGFCLWSVKASRAWCW